MPNWCDNIMKISHKDSSMISKFKDSKNLFHQWFPIPEDLANQTETTNRDEQVAISRMNVAKFGAKDWYDWANLNWGTKWDPELEEIEEISENELEVRFQSAWVPPIPGLREISEKFGFEINIIFNELGDCFCGEWDSEEGGIDYQYGSNHLAHIPEHIDEAFGISEFYKDNEF